MMDKSLLLFLCSVGANRNGTEFCLSQREGECVKQRPRSEVRMADLDKLRLALKQCVSGGKCEFMTYSEFGHRFGFGPRGPRKEALDAVAREFKKIVSPI
jgi:hypothetical protein